MDFDIELSSKLQEEDASAFKKELNKQYECSFEPSNSGQLVMRIRYSNNGSNKRYNDTSELIYDFLKGLETIKNFIVDTGEVRIGIFYNLEDTIVFPVILSAECINLMSSFNVSLDSTGYPCQ